MKGNTNAVSESVELITTHLSEYASWDTNYSNITKSGNVVTVNVINGTLQSGDHGFLSQLPKIAYAIRIPIITSSGTIAGTFYANGGWDGINYTVSSNTSNVYCQIVYICK